MFTLERDISTKISFYKSLVCPTISPFDFVFRVTNQIDLSEKFFTTTFIETNYYYLFDFEIQSDILNEDISTGKPFLTTGTFVFDIFESSVGFTTNLNDLNFLYKELLFIKI